MIDADATSMIRNGLKRILYLTPKIALLKLQNQKKNLQLQVMYPPSTLQCTRPFATDDPSIS